MVRLIGSALVVVALAFAGCSGGDGGPAPSPDDGDDGTGDGGATPTQTATTPAAPPPSSQDEEEVVIHEPIQASGTVTFDVVAVWQQAGMECGPQDCPRVPFSVQGLQEVTASLAWSGPSDFDFYLLNADGRRIAGSAAGGASEEEFTKPIGTGDYEFLIVPFYAVNGVWEMSATFQEFVI